MKSKTTHKTTAIVLRTFDYGESDRIVTFYTSEFGKIKGIAKGARRSQKRFANNLEPFSCSAMLFSKRSVDSLVFIESCEIIDHFVAIRADLEKTLIASYLIDLTDQFTLEGKQNNELYKLIRDFLMLIESGNTTDALIRFFEIRILKYSGYEPVFDCCTVCRTPISDIQTYRFNFHTGGIRCDSCYNDSHDCLPVALGTVKTLLMGKDMDLTKIHRLTLSPQAAEESKRLLAGFIRHILGKELKSVHVLNEIRRLGISVS